MSFKDNAFAGMWAVLIIIAMIFVAIVGGLAILAVLALSGPHPFGG